MDVDAQLERLRAEYGGDIEVYDFDALGAALDEDDNDLNDDTFGGGADIGKDFDFSGTTAKYLEQEHPQVTSSTLSRPPYQYSSQGSAYQPPPESTWTTMPSLLSAKQPPARTEASLGRLDHDPLLGPISDSAASSSFHMGSEPRALLAGSVAKQKLPTARTVEEIEAEMRLKVQQQQQHQQAVRRQAKTVEEIEAEMQRQALARQQQQQQQGTQRTVSSLAPARQSPSIGHGKLSVHAGVTSAPTHMMATSSSSPPVPPVPGMLHDFSGFGSARGGPIGHLAPSPHSARPNHSQWRQVSADPRYQAWLSQQQQQTQLRGAPGSPGATPSTIPPQLATLLGGGAGMMNAPLGPSTVAQSMSGVARSAASLPLSAAAAALIAEHERLDLKRRRKGQKVAEMSRYNALMTQSDKDFITRIQISQLMAPEGRGGRAYDAWKDDFYAHVRRGQVKGRELVKRLAKIAAENEKVKKEKEEKEKAEKGLELKPGSKVVLSGAGMSTAAGGRGGGTTKKHGKSGGDKNAEANAEKKATQRRLTRREHAMVKMAQNVQRIVDAARERPKMSQVSLDGALGKISSRTGTAPRQMLQVASVSSSNLANSQALRTTQTSSERRPALNKYQALMGVERVYITLLDLEAMMRQQAAVATAAARKADLEASGEAADADDTDLTEPPSSEEMQQKMAEHNDSKERMWEQLRLNELLDVSDPHPFVSLISTSKGKRVIPRALRHLAADQALHMLTLLLATFQTLDVVRDATVLDYPLDCKLAPPLPQGRRSRKEVERETELFLDFVLTPLLPVVNDAPLELVSGLLGVLLSRNNNMLAVVQSKPGMAFITSFLTRAQMLKDGKQDSEAKTTNGETAPIVLPPPNEAAISEWHGLCINLFDRLSADFASLFPSTRAMALLPMGTQHFLSSTAGVSDMAQTVRPGLDWEDAATWSMFALLSVVADGDRQQMLLASIRLKVLENVTAHRKKMVPEEIGEQKLRNVNTLLHALGLDSDMIQV